MGIRRDDKLCEIGIRQSGDMWRHIFFVLKNFRLFTFHGQCVFGGRCGGRCGRYGRCGVDVADVVFRTTGLLEIVWLNCMSTIYCK